MFRRFLSTALLAAVLAASPFTAAQATSLAVTERFYERSLMLEAGRRCDFFDARAQSALASATAQARGAALRAGVEASELTAVQRRAHGRAAATACDSPDLGQAAARVRTAFDGWARTPSMRFPGSRLAWTADRQTSRQGPRWRLSQTSITGASPVVAGQATSLPGDLQVVVSFVGRPRPIGARLILRDATRAPRPWLATAGAPLPQAWARRTIWAGSAAAAPTTLLPAGRTQGEIWVFGGGLDALAGLDPREVFAVEFLFRDDTVATVRFEAGDLSAARAFLAMGAV